MDLEACQLPLGCITAVVYARRLLDSLEADPPKPLHGACAKIGLTSIITSIRLMGVYYEHDHYDTLPRVHPALTETDYLSYESLENLEASEATQKSDVTNAQLPASNNSLRRYGSRSNPKETKNGTMDNFTLSDQNEQPDKIKQTGTGTTNFPRITQNDNNKKKRDQQSNGIFIVKPHQPTSFSTETFSKENLILEQQLNAGEKVATPQGKNNKVLRRVVGKPPLSTSSSSSSSSSNSSAPPTTPKFTLSNPGNYLDRCGLIQNPLASSVLQDLGYCSKRCEEVDLSEQYTRSGTGQKQPRTGWRWLVSDRTYSFIVLLVLIANLLRMARYPFVDQGISFAMIVIPSSWFLTTVLNNLWMFVSCTKPNHFLLFFQRWHILYNDPVTRGLGLRGLNPTKHNRYLLLMMWVFIGFNMLCCAIIMVMGTDFSAGLNKSFYITGNRSVFTIALTAVVLLYCSFAWLATPTLFVASCKFITTHFEEFEEIFRLHVTAAGNQMPKHLRLLRECHLAMCGTVEILDRWVRVSSGFTFTVAVTNACFLLFVLVNNTMDYTTFGIVLFWLVSSIFLVTLIVYYLGSVSDAMHSVGTSLLTIQTSGANQDQLAQLQMFLAKVNGPTMGFSVFGLITVTQDLILTLLSLYLTYAIILLQF